MSEVERIVDQLQRAYRGKAWHGPSLREVLDGVDAEGAARRALPSAHTIRELVGHVLAWEKECVARLAGHGRELTSEEDWPEVTVEWSELLDALDAVHEELTHAVSALTDGELEREVVVGERATPVYVLLHGVIQHNLYHAGQMAMLNKAR